MNAKAGYQVLTLAFGLLVASGAMLAGDASAQEDAAAPQSAVVQDDAAAGQASEPVEAATPVEQAVEQPAPPPVAAAKPAKANLNRSPARPRVLSSNQPTRAVTAVSTRPITLPRILGTYR